MNRQKKLTAALAFGALFIAILITGPSAGRVRSQSTTPTPPPEPPPPVLRTQFVRYGMHFVETGRSLRITVQNPRRASGEIIPCIRVRIILDVYEAAGDGSVRLGFARRVAREIELEADEAAVFDFPAARTGSFVSPTILATPEATDPPEPVRARILSTIAVREAGRTILNLPAIERGFDPQPDPPAITPSE
jgi:hypothetical protein